MVRKMAAEKAVLMVVTTALRLVGLMVVQTAEKSAQFEGPS